MTKNSFFLNNFKAGKRYCDFHNLGDVAVFYIKSVDENEMIIDIVRIWKENRPGFKLQTALNYKVYATDHPQEWLFGTDKHLCKNSGVYKRLFDILFTE